MKKDSMANIYRETFERCGGGITIAEIVSGDKEAPTENEVLLAFAQAMGRMKDLGKEAVIFVDGSSVYRVFLRIGRNKVGTWKVFSTKKEALIFVHEVRTASQREDIIALDPAAADFERKMAAFYLDIADSTPAWLL